MDDRTLWQVMRDAWIKIEGRFDPAIRPLVAKSNLTLREWMLLLAALTFEPEDTTPSHLMVRGPYTSSDRYLEGLEKAAAAGYLDQVGEGRYRLSQSGRQATLEFIEIARAAMVASSDLPKQVLVDLAGLLGKLVEECLNTPPPPDTWSITLSSKLMPPIDPPLPYIEQCISCLSAYRDDAHLASWCSSGLSASAMESLTLVWRGQVKSFRTLTRKLEFRGYPDSVYLDALAELRDREYLAGLRNNLRITDTGKKFRVQVEENTDQFFFSPWACLTAPEKEKIAGLLSAL